jgi:ABC-type multidrug transport system permease subunit
VKDLLFLVGANAASLAGVVCGCILAVNDNGWFWLFLLFALLMCANVSIKRKD